MEECWTQTYATIFKDGTLLRGGGARQVMLPSPHVSKTGSPLNKSKRNTEDSVVNGLAGGWSERMEGPVGKMPGRGRSEKSDGGDGKASSTVLRSCRAGRSRAAHLLQTAWCQNRRSSGCTPRWGRNECLRSSSSTSHRDSESWRAGKENGRDA